MKVVFLFFFVFFETNVFIFYQVYLPAIEGYVPCDVSRTFRAFLEFCYIVRLNAITEDTLAELDDALARFHRYRTIFERLNVRPAGFALPRQHFMVHYFALIRLFGAPNGLCSSITESMHRHAVKKPWRRSNRHDALGQMLLTNQRLDKLAAARVDFMERGMLASTCLSGTHNQLGMPCIPSFIAYGAIQILPFRLPFHFKCPLSLERYQMYR
jgi:hypothetical protein